MKDAVHQREARFEEQSLPGSVVRALSGGFERICYVDTGTGRYVKFGAQGKNKA